PTTAEQHGAPAKPPRTRRPGFDFRGGPNPSGVQGGWHAVPEGPARPAARGLRPQVEEQGRAYHTEAEARRDDRNQNSGREARQDHERPRPRDVPHTRGHLGGGRHYF